MICPNCALENSAGMRYCGQCGTLLATPPSDRPVEKLEARAERRQLTVMFCDLVGSTALSQRLDPEDLREVMLAYRDVCAKVIRRFEGHIAQFLGDGLLVYFGFPLAHEDDAQRAVRTGLGIVEAIQHLNPRLEREHGVRLSVRFGIHTGLVVAGDMGEGAQLQSNAVVGETPNLAARLQGLAEPDAVVVGPITFRLIQGYFHCEALGAQALKGIAQPVEVYRVHGESTARTRLDAAVTTGFTPLIGREAEAQLLLAHWGQVKAGQGQVVLLSGEAGIGKSRLVQMLREAVAADPQAWLTPCQCLAHYQDSALYPIIDLLERLALSFARDDTAAQKLRKLEGWLVQNGLALPETLPLFASMLSIPLGEAYAPLPLSPEQQKQKTLQALQAVLLSRAAQQPVLFVMEDLHWADPSTLELLSLLERQVPTARLLVLLTFRPEFTPPWEAGPHLTHLPLPRLVHQQAESMIAALTRGRTLPAEVLRQLVEKTDGVPLFVEELTKMVLESHMLREAEGRFELTSPLVPLAIPATLQDSLVARLDRLDTVKEVVQLASALGHEFRYDLLRAVSWLDDATLQRELGRLVQAELLYQSQRPPDASYIFKHALIQDTAYQQMLRSTRQQVHQRIAQVLEGQFAELAGSQPELLAHHYTEAALAELAIPYWHQAGQKAIERSANVEAINHLTKGLGLLKRLEETPERLQQELQFQTSLGPALMASKGFAAPEAVAAWSRAQELCQQVGATPQLFSALFGAWYFYGVRPELRKALDIAQELLRLGRQVQDPALIMTAHRTIGSSCIAMGEHERGMEHLRQALALYDPEQHRGLANVYGQDIGVICTQWSAWGLWFLGYPDQAEQMSLKAVAMAQEVSHALTVSYVYYFTAHFFQMTGDRHRAQAFAEQGFSYAMEQGIPVFAALSSMALGSLAAGDELAALAEREAGIARARQTIGGLRDSGLGLLQPFHLAAVGLAHGSLGQPAEGLAVVADALALLERGDEHSWKGELYRVQGELLLMQGDAEAAEASLRQALQIARDQGAKSYELRIALSLSRLLQQIGQTAQARQLLADIYGWFTEGFGTADLVEAKELLAELA